MLTGLMLTAFLMGLGGIPHCGAMCGTACAAAFPAGYLAFGDGGAVRWVCRPRLCRGFGRWPRIAIRTLNDHPAALLGDAAGWCRIRGLVAAVVRRGAAPTRHGRCACLPPGAQQVGCVFLGRSLPICARAVAAPFRVPLGCVALWFVVCRSRRGRAGASFLGWRAGDACICRTWCCGHLVYAAIAAQTIWSER